MKFQRPCSGMFWVVMVLGFCSGAALAVPSVARVWNEQILSAIRIDRPNPPAHARNLFHLAVAMYDAWSVYDSTAAGYLHHERQTAGNVVAARQEAISYAAFRILKNRYATSASAAATNLALDNQMTALGYSTAVTSTMGTSPAAVGNRIAAEVIAWANVDGANQLGAYQDPLYVNSQPPLIVRQYGFPASGAAPAGTDPTRWQPLAFDAAVTQNGLVAEQVQKYVGATWLKTLPFSLERTNATQPWINPGGPSKLNSGADAVCKQQVLELLRASSQLNSETLINASPGVGGQGNHPLGADSGNGRAVNPVTGLPYAENSVKRGDFTRVLAEYWADGPSSETPPGHWHKIANEVTDHPLTQKKIGGVGPIVDDLEWDVKLYFALSGGTHDAACAAWSLKRFYEGVRPITLVRYMGGKGQSSDPGQASYHPEGLLLEPGVVEVITEASRAPGERHFGIGTAGEIAVFSWLGEPADPLTEQSPVRWIRAIDWVPYQRSTFNTPAFPGFVSGHSTFSRAAAEVLAAFTGSEYFPGGLATFTANANSYLVFERGPSETVQLQWATYFDAADQAGQSRRWGGIHVPEDDYMGRIVGAECGKQAWKLAGEYFDGSVLTRVPSAKLTPTGAGLAQLDWKSKRGMYYGVETSSDLVNWDAAPSFTRAVDTLGTATVTMPGSKGFYRVRQKLAP